MSRQASCQSAAEYASGTAALHFGRLKHPSRAELEEAGQKTYRDVYHALCRSFATPHEKMIDELVSECRDYEATRRLTGYDPHEDDPEHRPPAEVLIEAMQQAIGDLRVLRGHQCNFSENEGSKDVTCSVCGTSGLT